MTRPRPVFRFRIVLTGILVYLMPSSMADDSSVWNKPTSTRHFLKCCTDKLQKEEIGISDNFFNSMIAAWEAVKESNSEIKSSMMNGAFAGQVASLCKTINCKATDNVLVKIVEYCSEKVTGHHQESLTRLLKSTVNTLMQESTTSDDESIEGSKNRLLPRQQEVVSHSHIASKNNPLRGKNSIAREKLLEERDISESSATSSAHSTHRQSNIAQLPILADDFPRLEKREKDISTADSDTHTTHEMRIDDMHINKNKHHVQSNVATLPQNSAALKFSHDSRPYSIFKQKRQEFSKEFSRSGRVSVNRQNILRNRNTDGRILNRRTKNPKKNPAHSSITQIPENDDVAEADALLKRPHLNYHSKSNYPVSMDSVWSSSSASSKSSSSVVSSSSLNTDKQSRLEKEPHHLVPRKESKRGRKPETKAMEKFKRLKATKIPKIPFESQNTFTHPSRSTNSLSDSKVTETSRDDDISITTEDFSAAENSDDLNHRPNQRKKERSRSSPLVHNLHPTGNNKQILTNDIGQQLISASSASYSNSIISKRKDAKPKTNTKNKLKKKFINFKTHLNFDKDTKNRIFSYVNSANSEERIEILEKLVSSCIKNGKFNYKLLNIYISTLTKYVQKIHPKFRKLHARLDVLLEVIIACTRILTKSPPDLDLTNYKNATLNFKNAYTSNSKNKKVFNIPHTKVPGMQNVRGSKMKNVRQPDIQYAGVPVKQNTAVSKNQNAAVPNMQNALLSKKQKAAVPNTQNALLPKKQNSVVSDTKNIEVSNTQNIRVPNMPNLVAPNMHSFGVSNVQNVGMSSMENARVPNKQNMAGSNTENAGVSNTQNTAMQNSNVPSFQKTFVPSLPNTFASSLQNTNAASSKNANFNFQSEKLPSLQFEINSDSQNINMPNSQAEVSNLQKTNILAPQNENLPTLENKYVLPRFPLQSGLTEIQKNNYSDNTDLVPHFATEQQPLLSPEQTKPNLTPGRAFVNPFKEDRWDNIFQPQENLK